jgi:hypothetical protein
MERVTQTLIEALARALAAPGEHRLYRAGKLDGLFAGRTGPSAEAVGRAFRERLLERSRLETKGKTEIEWVRITPRGVDFLHEHESPVHALHELLAALRTNQDAVPVWLDEMRGRLRALDVQLTADAGRWVERLAALETRIGETLRRLEAAAPLVPDEIARDHPWAVEALEYLDRPGPARLAPVPCPSCSPPCATTIPTWGSPVFTMACGSFIAANPFCCIRPAKAR